jgi:hypothetical protein
MSVVFIFIVLFLQYHDCQENLYSLSYIMRLWNIALKLQGLGFRSLTFVRFMRHRGNTNKWQHCCVSSGPAAQGRAEGEMALPEYNLQGSDVWIV